MILCLFVKQKTAYEVRISDWSSDVCSSDLPPLQVANASKNDKFNYSSSLSSSAAAKTRSSSSPRSTSLSGESPSSSTSMSRSSSPTKSASASTLSATFLGASSKGSGCFDFRTGSGCHALTHSMHWTGYYVPRP